MVDEFGGQTLLDIGCGTGVFACQLAERGVGVVGADPASASLDVARRKPGAGSVRWVNGGASSLPSLQVNMVTMTGNVAQVFQSDEEWHTHRPPHTRRFVLVDAWCSRPVIPRGAHGVAGSAN